MNKTPTESFFLSLIPNLWGDFVFYIPNRILTRELMDCIEGDELKKLLNKILVLDSQLGPMKFEKTSHNKNIMLKGAKLESNIFGLLEKRIDCEPSSFDYVLEKYFEQIDGLCYLTNWMNGNLDQAPQANDNLKGIFQLQFNYYKNHFETFIKHFYPTREAVPQGHFDIIGLIETYLPAKISNQYIKAKVEDSKMGLIQDDPINVKPTNKKVKKQPIITEMEAEHILLKSVFNLNLENEK